MTTQAEERPGAAGTLAEEAAVDTGAFDRALDRSEVRPREAEPAIAIQGPGPPFGAEPPIARFGPWPRRVRVEMPVPLAPSP